MHQQTQNQQLEKRRLRGRITKFYGLLLEQKWEECFTFIDPKLRDGGNISLDSYAKTLSSFFAAHGPLGDTSISELKLYMDARNKLYEDRAFAVGKVVVHDAQRRPHALRERWVKAEDGRWYTRMVGLV